MTWFLIILIDKHLPLMYSGVTIDKWRLLMRSLLLAGTLLVGMSVPAASAVVTWDFSMGPTGRLGTTETQLSVPGSVPIEATGFVNVSGFNILTDLFRKSGGFTDSGLGLAELHGEIHPGGFIQLDLSHVADRVGFSFSAASTDLGETWGLWLSNTAGHHGSATVLTGSDNNEHFIDATGFRFLDVGALSGDVLLHSTDATVIPEASTWAMLLVGFVGLMGLRMSKRGPRLV
jgi:hypothetical protein